MDSFQGKIADYIEKNKRNSKLNRTEAEGVCLLLKEKILEDPKSIPDVIEILLDLHYSITADFTNNAFRCFDKKTQDEIIYSFVRAEKVKKNANGFGIARCLVIVNALLDGTEHAQHVHYMLKDCSKKALGKDSHKSGELLYKNCIASNGTKIFFLDYSEWQETELKNLSYWLDNAILFKPRDELLNAYSAFLSKYNLPHRKNVGAENNARCNTFPETTPPVITNFPALSKKKEFSDGGLGKIGDLISSLHSECEKIINEKQKLSLELVEQKMKIEHADKEKNDMKLRVIEVEGLNNQLREKLAIKDIEINGLESKISDMSARLEYAYKADKRTENQELVVMRNDLAKYLKLDYEAFQKLALKEPHQYQTYYEALISIMNNIFVSLQRKGIVINRENEG